MDSFVYLGELFGYDKYTEMLKIYYNKHIPNFKVEKQVWNHKLLFTKCAPTPSFFNRDVKHLSESFPMSLE